MVVGTKKNRLADVCFWPGGKAVNPDVLRPGKASGKTQGKARFSLGFSTGFLGLEALYLSVTPARQAETVGSSQQCNFASCGSRAVTALVGVWGGQPQRSP